jgi:hypothetical protein
MVASLFLLKKETLDSFKELPSVKELPASDGLIFAVLVAVVLVVVGVVILVRIYVGRAAIAEGRGRKRSILYLVLAAIMILCNLFAIKNTLVPSPGDAALGGAFAKRNSASSIIIELTSAVMLFEMIVSACTIRKFRNKKSGQRPLSVVRCLLTYKSKKCVESYSYYHYCRQFPSRDFVRIHCNLRRALLRMRSFSLKAYRRNTMKTSTWRQDILRKL